MKLAKPGILLGIASALLVVGFVVWDSDRVSPGPLIASHAQAGVLEESDCERCHGSSGETMAAACTECHADVGAQIANKSGLHGTTTADVSRCGTCHGEHHGSDFQAVGPASFAAAGVPDVRAFRHENLGFELVDDHVGLDCKRCHEHADDVVLVKGTKRFLGESQACASCHEDPHGGRLPDCASCHGQSEPFATVARFVHPRSFELKGAHARAACTACHAPNTPFAIEASGISATDRDGKRAARTCVECHASPHREDFVASVASTLAQAAGATCTTCHRPEDAGFRAPDARITPAQHALAGFELAPPHDRADCAACHAPNTLLAAPPPGATPAAAFRVLHPGRAGDDCAACHVDVHGGQFAEGRFAGQNCLACHDRLAFEKPAFDVARHAVDTGFALTGKHATTGCGECHLQPSPTAPRRFHGTSRACADCHKDAHQGFFERPGVPTSFRGEVGCARCHTTDTFGPVATEVFDHATWTGFALTNAHSGPQCAECHPRRAEPDAARRTFGRVSEAFPGEPAACSGCHRDVHAGAFDGDSPAAAKTPARGCARCHDTQSFHGAEARFDHGAWTSFVLTGAHARAGCAACHEPLTQPTAEGRTFARATDQFPGPAGRCDTCHVDVHGGAFDRAGLPATIDGRAGCERCHTTESFLAVVPGTFDHGRWAAYPLEGAHARARCADCHPPLARPEPNGRSFARAAGTTCQSCHADSHVGQFSVDGATDCTRCHTTGTSFRDLSFDHQRDSRFALDERHEHVACARCHVSSPLTDGRTAVRYKPLGTECGDCHDPRGR